MNIALKNSGNKDRLEARISPDMKKLIQKAAELEGRTVSDFLISSSVAAARQVINAHLNIDLSIRDQVLFAEGLLNPPEPVHNLRVAAGKYKGRNDGK